MGEVVLQNDLRPSGDGGEVGVAVHPPQQSVKFIHKSERGVQGNLQARGYHTILPTSEAVEG